MATSTSTAPVQNHFEVSSREKAIVRAGMQVYLQTKLRARNKEVAGSALHTALSTDIVEIQAVLDRFQ